MLELYKALNKAAKKTIDENGKWMLGVAGIVVDNDDPENQHRVKVIIPSIDENMIYDEWIRQFVFCLGDGFGSVLIPPLGSEVVLFGELGQKYNLFYASLYSESFLISSELNKDTAGIHAPKNLSLIAEEVAKLLGKDIEIIAKQKAELKGTQIEVNGTTVKINGDGTVLIHGASVAITGEAVTILGRPVLNNGQPIL